MLLTPHTYRLQTCAAMTALALVMAVPVHAQTILDPSTWFSTGPEGDKQRQDELKQGGASREYKPRQIGLWLVESSADVGAVFDSNLYSSRKNEKSATGIGFAPRIVGRFTDGGQNTNAYIDGNVRYFSGDESLSTFGGRIGIGNSLELQRGTIWKALLQVGRAQDDGSAYNATGQGSDGSGIYVKPINSNSLFAATSILSRLDFAQFSGFASAGLSANLTRYEDAELSNGQKVSQGSRDSNSYTVTGRVGWSLAPTIYTFIEPSVIMQQAPNVTDGDTTAYRGTIGIGTDRINLVKGEIYGGFIRQSYNSLSDQDKDGAVYGFRLSWFPTRDLTLDLSADDSLGVTATGTGSNTKVYTTRTKTVAGNLNYSFDRRITASLRSSYSNVDYDQSGRNDDIVRLGADVTYMITTNFGLRAGFANVNVQSTDDLNSVSRNIYTIGLNGRF